MFCLRGFAAAQEDKNRRTQGQAPFVLGGFHFIGSPAEKPAKLLLRSDLVVLAVLFLVDGVAGDIHAQAVEGLAVHAGEDDRRVHVAALEVGQLVQSSLGVFVLQDGAGQGDQNLVGVEAGILAAEIGGLQLLDRLNGPGRHQLDFLVDARQLFQGVEQGRGSGAQQGTGLAGDDGAVRQLDGGGGQAAGLFGAGVSHLFHRPAAHRQACLVDQQLQLEAVVLGGAAHFLVAQALHVAAQNLLQRGLAADFVVNDAVAGHVDAHVGGGAVGALAGDQVEHGVQHREDLDVAVVVDRRLPVGLQMEGVDHVDIVQVGGGGLIGQVHRVLQGQVPDGEGLKLGVAGLYAALVFMVQLGQADRHFSAAGAGCSDHHQGPLGLDVVVFAVALIADDPRHIAGITGDLVVAEGADAQAVELFLKGFHLRLGGVHGHADAAHKQPHALEGVDQAQHVHVVSDAVVAADLVVDDVLCADDHDDLGLILQLQQHLELGVGLETGQHAGSMVIVEQFAAEFHIQLVVELGDPVPDMRRLHGKVLVVVKSYVHLRPTFL